MDNSWQVYRCEHVALECQPLGSGPASLKRGSGRSTHCRSKCRLTPNLFSLSSSATETQNQIPRPSLEVGLCTGLRFVQSDALAGGLEGGSWVLFLHFCGEQRLGGGFGVAPSMTVEFLVSGSWLCGCWETAYGAAIQLRQVTPGAGWLWNHQLQPLILAAA